MPKKPNGTGFQTVDDLLASLGGVSPRRVRMTPAPGTATVRDVIRLRDRDPERRLYELVDGTLVEKPMGAKESWIAARLIILLGMWDIKLGGVGMILGADGTLKLLKKLVRIPDVSFTNWDRLPNRKVPTQPVPELAPDLAVEVLSDSNTVAEMEQKLKEYFLAGVRLVWYIDDRDRSVRVFTSPDDVRTLGPDDPLDGGDVLPGFALVVRDLFTGLPDEPRE